MKESSDFLFVVIIPGEPHGSGMFQLLVAAAIIDAAITVMIPILHKLSTAEVTVGSGRPSRAPTETEDINAELERIKQQIQQRR